MGKDNGWQWLAELSKILQAFRHMYLHRQAEEDHLSLGRWRRQLRQFLKVNQAHRPLPGYCCIYPRIKNNRVCSSSTAVTMLV